MIKTKTIAEVTERLIDYRGKTPKKSKAGVRLITAKVVKNGFILDEKMEYISEKTYDKWMTRGIPQQWDILLTTEAPMGEVAQIRNKEKIALAQRIILLRGNPKKIDQNFFFHALKSPFVQNQLKSRLTGTTVKGIKQSELKTIKIPYYSLTYQKKVAKILSCFDDLLENNLFRIKILEDYADSLYFEWLVYFRHPQCDNASNVNRNEKYIPKGWKLKKFGEISQFKKGIKPKRVFKEMKTGLVPHLLIKSLKKNEYTYTDDPKVWAKSDDTIMVMDGGSSGSTFIGFEGVIGSTLGLYRSVNKDEVSPYLIYHFLKANARWIAKNNVGSAIPHANKDFIDKMDFIIPSNYVNLEFNDIFEKIHKDIKLLKEINLRLISFRDSLLPKLITAEINVKKLTIEGKH